MNLPITITIPKFVRKILVSDKQRANYYEWDGNTIKGKGKKLPLSFYKNKNNLSLNTRIEDLKDYFALSLYYKGKLKGLYRDSKILSSINLNDKDARVFLSRSISKEINLFTFESFEKVISNPRIVGKPRYYLIRGQDIYSGNLREHFRGFVMDSIKKSYLPYVKDLPVIDSYPVKIECELHDTIKNHYDQDSSELGQRFDLDNYIYPYYKAFPDLLTNLGKLKDDDRLHVSQIGAVKFCPVDNHEDRKLVFIISLEDREVITQNSTYQTYHSGVQKNSITGETEDNDLRDILFD